MCVHMYCYRARVVNSSANNVIEYFSGGEHHGMYFMAHQLSYGLRLSRALGIESGGCPHDQNFRLQHVPIIQCDTSGTKWLTV